jgi:hypothetical protein
MYNLHGEQDGQPGTNGIIGRCLKEHDGGLSSNRDIIQESGHYGGMPTEHIHGSTSTTG